MEPIIAGEIIQGFKHVYRFAENLGRAVFANFPTVFSYDQLEDKWRKVGRPLVSAGTHQFEYFEMVNFTEMLLRMGILGEVETITDRYIETKFAYSMLIPFAVGEKAELAIHPIFSRYFSCSGNKHQKSILPVGAEFDVPKSFV